ncbi:MAG: hypothetical protein GY705_25455, partial [Bacteroidetes bacterium]|nr:hypothetical protein [Bacteroidota bacterium]
MKKLVLTLISFCCMSFFLMAQDHTIGVSSNVFTPNELTIQIGETVTWQNNGGFHNVNGTLETFADNPKGFGNGDASSDSWTYQNIFVLPGVYNYQCDPHAGLGMTGTITVVEATSPADIVITEIMYNPPESGSDSLEFIELYNNGTETVNLEGYSFLKGVTFTFPSYELMPDSYALVAVDSIAFQGVFGKTAFQWTSGGLSNSGEWIVLGDNTGIAIDSVDYDDGGGWPEHPDGDGSSLVLCDVNADNTGPDFWDLCATETGIIVNSKEVFANPGSASNCLTGSLFQFSGSDMEVSEDADTLKISITLTNPCDFCPGQGINIAVSDQSTATLGEDFSIPETYIAFSGDGSGMAVTKTIDVIIIDDGILEDPESIILLLSEPVESLIHPVFDEYTITVMDNDTDLPDLVISEIMYNTPGVDDYEYLEITNNGTEAVELEGYNFSAGINFTFPAHSLDPGERIVLVINIDAWDAVFTVPALQWTSGSLKNSGEKVTLNDPAGNVIDEVEYGDADPWYSETDGVGSAIILCDLNADNSDPANWAPSYTSTGIFLSGTEVLGSPGAANDCSPPEPAQYPAYDIGVVTTSNVDGEVDSLGVKCQIHGVVYGVNMRSSGLQFTLIDSNNDGIGLISFSDDWGYTVQEGDEVIVQGVIGFYNGLTQINPDSVWMVSAGNSLFDPTIVTALGEETESQLITIENVTLVDPASWGSGSFNTDVTNGTD